jgi:LPS-assembly lipoprotein
MWCSDRRALLLALPALAACGFEPLYAPGAPASRMAGRVEVPVLEGADGFVMRERLTERLGTPETPTHRLEVVLALETAGVALTTENVTTRFNVVGTADYALVPMAGGPPALSGQLRAVTGYSAPETDISVAYASLSSDRDARRRLARELADRIVERLAIGAPDWTS